MGYMDILESLEKAREEINGIINIFVVDYSISSRVENKHQLDIMRDKIERSYTVIKSLHDCQEKIYVSAKLISLLNASMDEFRVDWFENKGSKDDE